mgnify:CR=1 FL=1
MLPACSGADGGNGRASRTLALARIAEPTEAVHQHGVVRRGIRLVDDASQQLVVPGGRQGELGTDGLLLDGVVHGPPRLEVEEEAITLGEGHLLTLTPRSALAGTPLQPSPEWVGVGEDDAVARECEALSGSVRCAPPAAPSLVQ